MAGLRAISALVCRVRTHLGNWILPRSERRDCRVDIARKNSFDVSMDGLEARLKRPRSPDSEGGS